MSFWRSCYLFFCLIMVSGCEKAAEEPAFDETPEAAAINFFTAVYQTRDMDTVLELSTPRMRRLIDSYAAIPNVQRHILNRLYDEVNLTLDTGNIRMRTQYAEQMTVTIVMTGFYQDKKIDEVRRVHLKNINNHWRVDEIENDVYY